MVSVTEAAKVLGISRRQAFYLVTQSQIPVYISEKGYQIKSLDLRLLQISRQQKAVANV